MPCGRYARRHVLLTGLLFTLSISGFNQTPQTIADQLSTAEHVKQPGWWPTKGSALRTDYLGPEKCASCHSEISGTQHESHMALTASSAAESDLLRKHGDIVFNLGSYTYKIIRAGNQELYSVSNGAEDVTEPLTWAFGAASNGQSYLFDHNGKLYEARLTYYRTEDKFDISPNHPTVPAATLEDGLGRHISTDEAPKCFGCHTTASSTAGKFTPTDAIPGITCEQCHGPGATHVAAHKSGLADSGVGAELNPARLTPVQAVDFCGACHRTWWDVTLDGLTGVGTVRFPAYRLEKSRCWGKGDMRATCMACHDPHKPLVKETAAYDSRCLGCHQGSTSAKPTADHPGVACRVAQRDCASCHMPKYEIPEMHTKFTDHMIRVVKKNEVFPQ